MGMQLNIGDHRSKVSLFLPIPLSYRADAQWARTRARYIASNMPSADVYFRSLSGGRSLTALLADRSIWVNFMISTAMGAAVADWKEIGISESCFRKGRSSVLGTLIHELAHLNGAANGTTDAEDALVYCGLGTAWEYVLGIDDPSTVYVPGMRN